MANQIDEPIQGHAVGENHEVYCLCIDVAHCTDTGLSMNSLVRREFFQAIVEQLRPYLETFELCNATVKFTGDGWLVMQPGKKAARQLVALAKTLCASFQSDISSRLSDFLDDWSGKIPAIRTSLFWGIDTAVAVPVGCDRNQTQLDWVGDSARLATRYNPCSEENGLVVGSSVYRHIMLDFAWQEIDIEALPEDRRPKREEEHVLCYSIGDLNQGLVAQISSHPSDDYKYYAMYLSLIGEITEATALAGAVHSALNPQIEEQQCRWQYEEAETRKLRHSLLDLLSSTEPGNTRDSIRGSLERIGYAFRVSTYNLLISRSSNYEAAMHWYEDMAEKGVVPDVVTYNTLVNRAPDYEAAMHWYEDMAEKGVVPDVVTYSTLVNRAPDYEAAMHWYKDMAEKGVVPDVVTYNTLVNRAPDYEAAVHWYEDMAEKGVVPNERLLTSLVKQVPSFRVALELTDQIKDDGFIGKGYFCTLFAKDVKHLSGEELLQVYNGLPYRYEVCLEPAIRTYLSANRLDDALRICLFAPHLPAALRVYRTKPTQAEAWFRELLKQEPGSSNALYGLGICLFENRQYTDAESLLRKAREKAYAEARITHIDRMLEEIRSQRSKGEK